MQSFIFVLFFVVVLVKNTRVQCIMEGYLTQTSVTLSTVYRFVCCFCHVHFRFTAILLPAVLIFRGSICCSHHKRCDRQKNAICSFLVPAAFLLNYSLLPKSFLFG